MGLAAGAAEGIGSKVDYTGQYSRLEVVMNFPEEQVFVRKW